MPPAERIKAEAHGAGLTALMRKFGYTDAQLDACLADEAQQHEILGMTQQAWQVERIPGTPSFFINGRRVEGAVSWTSLEPALRTALN
jgi:protein-disulfide isomerase